MPSPTVLQSQFDLAMGQIQFARDYTLGLIDDVAEEQWYTMPAGCQTHLAWQLGHLAMAEYGLCLFRIRGRQPQDADLMSSSFRKSFLKGSQPNSDTSANPSPLVIRDVLANVHQHVLDELAEYDVSLLGEEVDKPYAAYNNKIGSLLFCSHHEMLHAGQIGLLRRMLGKSPLR